MFCGATTAPIQGAYNKRTRHTPRKPGIALVVFLLGSGLLLSPILTITALEDESGFVAYGSRWEMNDALFMAIHKATELAT